jgi:hypothetical protein
MIRCAILEKENTFLISLLKSSTRFLYRERACEPIRLASGRLARASARRACPSSGNRASDRKLTHLGVAAPDADDSGQGTALDPAWQGVFCVRLNVEPSAREMQPTAVCIDPGSKKEGYSVVAVAHTYSICRQMLSLGSRMPSSSAATVEAIMALSKGKRRWELRQSWQHSALMSA